MFAFAFDLAKHSVRREGPAGRTDVATEEARTQDAMREGRGGRARGGLGGSTVFPTDRVQTVPGFKQRALTEILIVLYMHAVPMAHALLCFVHLHA